MGEHHGHAPAITQHPPARSWLRKYADQFDELAGQEPPLCESADPRLRLLAVRAHIEEGKPCWTLPEAALREALVHSYQQRGMPNGPRPQWLADLIDSLAFWMQQESRLGDFYVPSTRRRVGRPTERTSALMIIHAAYIDAAQHAAPGTSENRLYEEVAARLKPEVDRHHVRRAVKRLYQQLGGLDELHRDCLLHALLCLARMMRVYDDTHRLKPIGVRNYPVQTALLARKS